MDNKMKEYSKLDNKESLHGVSPDVICEKRELIVKGGILDYYKDTMRFSNGNTEVWDFIDHKPVVSIVPIDEEDDKIICVRQYRPAIGRYSLEIPAGGIGEDTDPKIGALRELKEETGYECSYDEAEHLVDIYTSVGFSNEKIYIYEARVHNTGNTNPDENEFVNVEKYTLKEMIDMILSGKLKDSKTVSAIMSYAAKHK